MRMPQAWKQPLEGLTADLELVFGRRLHAVVAFDSRFAAETPMAGDDGSASDVSRVYTLVLVESVEFADLMACAGRAAAWAKARLATPLLMTDGEFRRSLDAFPLELSAIEYRHVLVAGHDPFEQATIRTSDVRRACETQAKSLLLHLREGFVEARGEERAVARLVAASVPSLRTLLVNLVRLDDVSAPTREALARHAAARIDVPVALVEQVLSLTHPGALDRSDAHRVYTAYLDAVERLSRFVDGWNAQ